MARWHVLDGGHDWGACAGWDGGGLCVLDGGHFCPSRDCPHCTRFCTFHSAIPF